MAGPNLQLHCAMNSVQTVVTSTPLTVALPEKAGQVFPMGVPVQLSNGFVQKWDGATILAGFAGIALIPASNLATNGAGAPGMYSQVTGTGSTSTYGSVPNMPGAVNIATGAPFTDGRTLFESCNLNTIFEGQFDNSNGNVAADYSPTLATIGQQFGITFDANGSAYVDAAKTTPGTNTCVKVVSIHPLDFTPTGSNSTFIPNARVRFQFLPSAIQIY